MRTVMLAPFACADFTVRFEAMSGRAPVLRAGAEGTGLKEVARPLDLSSGTWYRAGNQVTACFALPRGASRLSFA